MYRARHVRQQGPADCRLAVGATMLDYCTVGKLVTSPKELRRFTEKPRGNTEPSDLQRALREAFGVDTVLRGAQRWERLIDDLLAGRFVALDIFRHTIGIAPEFDGKRILISDPKEPDYQWIDGEYIRRAGVSWGKRFYAGDGLQYMATVGELNV
jgi:hypothetical protein